MIFLTHNITKESKTGLNVTECYNGLIHAKNHDTMDFGGI